MDCSLPGFSNHGIFQERVLEWVASAFSKRMSAAAAKSGQSCPTLCDPIDGSAYVATNGVCKWHFHDVAFVNGAAMNIEVHVFFQIMVFSRHMPRCGIVGS